MKLHVGIDPIKQAVTQAHINKLKDYFIKQIKMYYKGKTPTPSVVTKTNNKTKPTKSVSNEGRSKNSHGTYYKSETGTFKCTVRQGIVTRNTGPFTTCPQSGVLYYGQSVKYDTVCKQDGYVRTSWTNSKGKDVWMPVRTWDKNTGKVGVLCGDIS